jgi:hypothetical protein
MTEEKRTENKSRQGRQENSKRRKQIIRDKKIE